jgi:UDP-glucuronate decarboxylase
VSTSDDTAYASPHGRPLRILVTGGSGFIGSHLCHKLLLAGHQIIALDNFCSGDQRNLRDSLGNPRFKLVTRDITSSLYFDVDQIYHLACPASPLFYQRDPVRTTKTCVLGSINVLELARQLMVPTLLASTSEVYGDASVHPQPESYWGNVNPIGPRACYDEGKRCAESLFVDYHRQYGFPVKIARIFNTYGPHMRSDDGRVVPNFIRQALDGAPITVYGDGTQTRSFCHVDDTVNALISLMNSPPPVTGPVNIGNPEEFTIQEVAEQILQATSSSSKIEYKSLPPDDPTHRKPDITLARAALAWQPTIELSQGIAECVAYFKECRIANT